MFKYLKNKKGKDILFCYFDAIMIAITTALSIAFYNKLANIYYVSVIVCAGYFFVRNYLEKGVLLFDSVFLSALLILLLMSSICNPRYAVLVSVWRNVRFFLLLYVGYAYVGLHDMKERKVCYYMLFSLLFYSLLYELIIEKEYWEGYRRVSILGNPIVLCSACIFLFWLIFYLCKNVFFKTLLLILTVFGNILTYSRSGWIGLLLSVVVLAVYYIINLKKTKKKVNKRACIIVVGLVLTGIILLIATGYMKKIVDRIADTKGSYSATYRFWAFAEGMKDFFLHSNPLQLLFGHGNGYSIDLISEFPESIGTVDNTYCSLLTDSGLLMFWLTIWLIFDLVLQGNHSKELTFLSMGLLGVFASAFFYDIIGWLNISTFLYLFIGIYLGVRKDFKKNEKKLLKCI